MVYVSKNGIIVQCYVSLSFSMYIIVYNVIKFRLYLILVINIRIKGVQLYYI